MHSRRRGRRRSAGKQADIVERRSAEGRLCHSTTLPSSISSRVGLDDGSNVRLVDAESIGALGIA